MIPAIRSSWWSLSAAAVLVCALAFASQAQEVRLCSGGAAAGRSCSDDSGCPQGFCVRAAAVCDGGGADRFDCPCPGGSCSRDVPCPNDEDLGTCVGGPRAGSCCEPLLACEDGAPCVATTSVCLDGDEQGFGCLRDEHCPGSTCSAAAQVCRGGLFDGGLCADSSNCRGGVCFGINGPVGCPGDCDGSGDVTVDELITMVNIALGAVPVTACEAGDLDSSGTITVDEVVVTVNAALAGCAAVVR